MSGLEILLIHRGSFSNRYPNVYRINFESDLSFHRQEILMEWIRGLEPDVEFDWRDNAEVELSF